MSTFDPTTSGRIPEADIIPWRIALTVSWMSLKRRIWRAMITMVGVILAIAFLMYMLTADNILTALINLGDDKLNLLLQEKGVDIYSESGTDQMTLLLVGLALVTCLVGIVNAMLMAVTERIKEIGTLKCVGAQDTFILQTYFIESSLQGLLGTATGIVIGLLIAVIGLTLDYGGYVFRDFPFGAVLVSLLVSLAIGLLLSVLAAIAPAFWASRKQPVEALRVEE